MAEASFENNIKRLEEIIRKLDEGNCTLDESIKLYEEGSKLAKVCEDKLEKAEQKITQLQINPEVNK